MSRFKRSNKEEKVRQLKEIFAILSQGVEMIHYYVRPMNKKYKPNKMTKIVWLDADTMRFCTDITRPTILDRQKDVISPGIYLRDVSDVRKGIDAYDFIANAAPPQFPDHCLTLIGSERCLSFELPSKFTRDWFYERLKAMVADIFDDSLGAERSSRILLAPQSDSSSVMRAAVDPDAASHLSGVLRRGIQVLLHHPNGKILRGILRGDGYGGGDVTRLVVEPVDKTFFGYPVAKPMSLLLLDISEIRLGTHSYTFVETNSTHKHDETLSLIGSECTLALQLATLNARNIFASRLRNLLQYARVRNTRPPSPVPDTVSGLSVRGAQRTMMENSNYI